MKNWEQALVGSQTSMRTALEIINEVGCQMVLIVDKHRKLLGTLSDGDARRALLRGLTLSDPVDDAMHVTPLTAFATDDRQARLLLMRRLSLHQLPVITPDGVVVGLETVDDYLGVPVRDEWVVIMAGGLGSRLKELTRDTPKPMLKVGSRPLLETIVRTFAEQGFQRIYLAVNHMAERIESHFGNGKSYGLEIRYLREKHRLGTAGALGLLPEKPSLPLVVTNADLLTKEDYGEMIDLHLSSNADATMGVREYEMQVPFGVVRENQGRIDSIEEKPTHRHLVSAGMYVLSPSAVSLIPKDRFFDMPTLFESIVSKGMHARSHRVDGYWLDIGQPEDYVRANSDFDEVFK